MKKFIITLVLVVASVINVNAMSKYRSSREARFLTDKMAWELDLSYSQMEDVYEINYDYFRSLVRVHANNSFAYEIRNEELSYVLSPRQWARFMAIEYFYIPVRVKSYSWVFPIYNHYKKDRFYYDAPHAYSHYTGIHAHNKDFYRGRTEIHNHAHEHGLKPMSSGNIGHAHGMERRPTSAHGHNAAPQHNNGNAKPQQNAPQHNNGNAKPQQNAPQHNNGNAKPQQHNNNNNAVPNRNTTNRSQSGEKANTRVDTNNNQARPSRSQNANQNNTGRGNTTSGRR